jgi:exodeoxyribonuclease VII large subunit
MMRTDSLEREIHAKSPKAKLAMYNEKLDTFGKQIQNAVQSQIAGKSHQLITETKRIEALSPLNVLMRGYSIVTTADNKAILDTDDIHIGDEIGIKLHKGKITAEVLKKHG